MKTGLFEYTSKYKDIKDEVFTEILIQKRKFYMVYISLCDKRLVYEYPSKHEIIHSIKDDNIIINICLGDYEMTEDTTKEMLKLFYFAHTKKGV